MEYLSGGLIAGASGIRARAALAAMGRVTAILTEPSHFRPEAAGGRAADSSSPVGLVAATGAASNLVG
jgi:hypothetical protein